MTRRRGKEASERRSEIEEDKAFGDGATSRSVEAFQCGDVGNA